MRQPYQRPIDPHWWAKSPYLGYTLREATGIAVAAYALVLLAGVICLAAGENAYHGWLGFLASRWSHCPACADHCRHAVSRLDVVCHHAEDHAAAGNRRPLC